MEKASLATSMICGSTKVLPSTSLSSQEIQASKPSDIQVWALLSTGSVQTYLATTPQLVVELSLIEKAFNGSGANWANLTASSTALLRLLISTSPIRSTV